MVIMHKLNSPPVTDNPEVLLILKQFKAVLLSDPSLPQTLIFPQQEHSLLVSWRVTFRPASCTTTQGPGQVENHTVRSQRTIRPQQWPRLAPGLSHSLQFNCKQLYLVQNFFHYTLSFLHPARYLAAWRKTLSVKKVTMLSLLIYWRQV